MKDFMKNKRKFELALIAAGEVLGGALNTIVNFRNGEKLTKGLLRFLGINAVLDLAAYHVIDYIFEATAPDDEFDEELDEEE